MLNRFFVTICLTSVQKDHVLGTMVTIGSYVDNWVVQKVYELVRSSNTNFVQVRRCLSHFV